MARRRSVFDPEVSTAVQEEVRRGEKSCDVDDHQDGPGVFTSRAHANEWSTRASDLWGSDGLAMLLTCAADAIVVLDEDGGLRFANPAAQRMLGHEPGSLLGSNAFELIHPEDRDRATDAFATTLSGADATAHVAVRLLHLDGRSRHVEITARNLLDDAAVSGIVLNIRDVTDLVVARGAEAASERRFRELADGAADLIFRYRVAEPVGFDYLNAAAESLTGHDAEALIDDPTLIDDMVGNDVIDRLAARSLSDLQHEPIEFELKRADGSTRWVQLRLTLHLDDAGRVVMADGIVRDLSARYAAEQELARRALHDDLTGLPNRSLFHDRLETALRRADRNPSSPAVLFCDIDDFKSVNDTHGHAVGDHVLQVTAQRLADVIRQGDTAARLGGDEFLVMCNDVTDVTELAIVCDRLRHETNQPIVVDGGEVAISVSIGAAWATPESTASDLLRSADHAMYQEKARN